MKKQISSKTISLIFAVIVICFAIGFYIYAWTEPTEAPPGGNVPAPLNTGIDGQSKEGGLLLGNSSTVTNGLIVRYGNVGIGTTNPAYKLEMVSTSSGWGARIRNNYDGAARSYIYMGHSGGYGMHIRGYTTDSKYTLQLYNANAETNRFLNDGRVFLGLQGNVGIGTTNPGYKLDVNGDINLPATGFLRIAGNAGSSGQVLTRTATGMAWQAGAAGGIGGSGTDNYIPRWNGATNLENSIIYQTDAGNVGIGTPSPGAKLEVAGQIKITDGTQGAGKVLTSDVSGLASWQTPSGGGGLNCITRTTAFMLTTATATCLAGEIITGGGCRLQLGAAWVQSAYFSGNSYVCSGVAAGGPNVNIMAYARCCQ